MRISDVSSDVCSSYLNIKNVTVYVYASADIVPISLPVDYASGTGPNGEFAAFHFLGSEVYGAVGGTNALFDCGTSPSCDPDLAISRVRAGNYKRYYSSVSPFTHAKVQGLKNTTTIDFEIGRASGRERV